MEVRISYGAGLSSESVSWMVLTQLKAAKQIRQTLRQYSICAPQGHSEGGGRLDRCLPAAMQVRDEDSSVHSAHSCSDAGTTRGERAGRDTEKAGEERRVIYASTGLNWLHPRNASLLSQTSHFCELIPFQALASLSRPRAYLDRGVATFCAKIASFITSLDPSMFRRLHDD